MNWLPENYDVAWKECFTTLSSQLQEIDTFLTQRADEVTIYPPRDMIFNALKLVTPMNAKVVIIGQDPYHGEGEAMGLSFSVPRNITVPPSLRNIYKERESDLRIPPSPHGDLTSWAEQGVLLLNASLTVEKDSANSHSKIGWDSITDGIISYISKEMNGVIFLLWGKFAEKKQILIDKSKHHVLVSPHPSPFSARRGFFGSKPFSKINTILENEGKTPIDWRNA